MITISPRLKRFGSRFAFEFFLECMHDPLIGGFRKYLEPIKTEDIQRMIGEGTFPSLEDVDLSAVTDQAEFLENIDSLRLMEFLAEARPDLAQSIVDAGAAGAEWVVKLRQHLLGKVKHPEKTLSQSTDYAPKKDMVMATCDKCQKQWPVPREQAASIKECPFCHQS